MFAFPLSEGKRDAKLCAAVSVFGPPLIVIYSLSVGKKKSSRKSAVPPHPS